MVRRILGCLAALLVAACGATAPSSTPARPLSPSTVPAASIIAAPSPSPSLQPSEPPGIGSVSGPWSGLRWSARTTFPNPSGVDSLVTFRGQLYAVGEVPLGSATEVAVWRSDDGTNWSKLTQGGSVFSGAGFLTLLATTTGLVAWGQDGEPACSAPGAGQTCGPVLQMIWTSPDGITWARAAHVSMFDGATIQGIADGRSGLVAVGDTGSGKPAIWVSARGATWERLPLDAAFAGAHLFTVRAAGRGYVVGGGTGAQQVSVTGGPASTVPLAAAVWWSADARTWTKGSLARSSAGGAYVSEIFVGADGMVAVGSATGGKEGAAWTSPDGRLWTPIAAGYADAPSPAPGEPTLPSYTIADDGIELVAMGYADRNVVTWWGSMNGTSWQPLALSGATDTSPVWQGDPVSSDRWFDHAYVVPDGLVVVGAGTGDPPVTALWHAIAMGVPATPTIIATAAASTPPPVPALSVDDPTVAVVPPDGLVDGQTVVVHVTGFGVGGKVWLSECASPADATDLGCGSQLAAQPFLGTDDARTGKGTFTVRSRAASTPLGQATTACTDECVIVATLGGGFGYAVAPIAFSSP